MCTCYSVCVYLLVLLVHVYFFFQYVCTKRPEVVGAVDQPHCDELHDLCSNSTEPAFDVRKYRQMAPPQSHASTVSGDNFGHYSFSSMYDILPCTRWINI